jgi:type I restriction-modification system DNA methylase subunit
LNRVIIKKNLCINIISKKALTNKDVIIEIFINTIITLITSVFYNKIGVNSIIIITTRNYTPIKFIDNISREVTTIIIKTRKYNISSRITNSVIKIRNNSISSEVTIVIVITRNNNTSSKKAPPI